MAEVRDQSVEPSEDAAQVAPRYTPGWYIQTDRPGVERYHDGDRWTDAYRDPQRRPLAVESHSGSSCWRSSSPFGSFGLSSSASAERLIPRPAGVLATAGRERVRRR